MRIKTFLEHSPIFLVMKGQQRILKLINEKLKGDKLNLTQALMLVGIYFEKGNEVRPSDFIHVFVTTKGNVSHCLSHLEGEGFIKRKMVQDDARGYLFEMTPSGEALAQKYIKYFDDSQKLMEENIGISELFMFRKVLNQVIKLHS